MAPSVLENLYISPLETCNLHCRYCYTTKAKNILTNSQILDYVDRYQKNLKELSSPVKGSSPVNTGARGLSLKSVIFCGGEVFTLPDFPQLVNQLISQNLFITIITNGTIDRLSEINNPQNCQILVSFDGPQKIHNHNRGAGNFQKSIAFTKHSLELGFPTEIFFLITRDSYPYRHTFSDYLSKALKLQKSQALNITYLTDRLGSLNSGQVNHIRQNYPCYPPQKFGCSILSLQSDGNIYSCCESIKPIGNISDPINKILDIFTAKVTKHPLCSDPNFFCNLKP